MNLCELQKRLARTARDYVSSHRLLTIRPVKISADRPSGCGKAPRWTCSP